MKLTTYFLMMLLLLATPFHSVSAKKGSNNEVRLTAGQVDGADDIEAAIIKATDKGTHPGTVIMDGTDGPFVFTGVDKSLNIFISDISLRGEDNAQVAGCDDGLFFEGTTIQHIVIERISFICTGDGVDARGVFNDVALRENTFKAAKNGINIRGASNGWEITNNDIVSGLDGIRLNGAQNIYIEKNEISGNNGVVVLGSTQVQVKQNTIHAVNQGILLGQESSNCIVQANKILGVSLAGIALEPSIVNNRILANKVTCAAGKACVSVDIPQNLGKGNKIDGNSRK